MLLLAVDFAALWLMLRLFLGNKSFVVPHAVDWVHLWPLLTLFLVLYCSCGAYPGISVGSVDDIKRIFTANLNAFLFVSLTLAYGGAPVRSQLMWFGLCAAASVVLVTIRSAVRRVGSRFSWWGFPVVLRSCMIAHHGHEAAAPGDALVLVQLACRMADSLAVEHLLPCPQLQ